jgi:hypothetical protein
MKMQHKTKDTTQSGIFAKIQKSAQIGCHLLSCA